MTRQGGFGEGGWKNMDTGSGPGSVGKFMRSSAAVPLFLVGGLAAVVVTAGAVSLYGALNQDDQDQNQADATGTGASFGNTATTGYTGPGYYGGYHGGYWGGSSFSSGSGGGSGHPASGGGTSRGGFGGTGHSGGGS